MSLRILHLSTELVKRDEVILRWFRLSFHSLPPPKLTSQTEIRPVHVFWGFVRDPVPRSLTWWHFWSRFTTWRSMNIVIGLWRINRVDKASFFKFFFGYSALMGQENSFWKPYLKWTGTLLTDNRWWKDSLNIFCHQEARLSVRYRRVLIQLNESFGLTC